METTTAKRLKCWAKHIRNRENRKIRKLLARAFADSNFIIDYTKLNLNKHSFELRVQYLHKTHQTRKTQSRPSTPSPSYPPPSYSPVSSPERSHSPISPDPQSSRIPTPPPPSDYSHISQEPHPSGIPPPPPPFDYLPSFDHQSSRIPIPPPSSRLESSDLPRASHDFEEALQDFVEKLPDLKEEPKDFEQRSFDTKGESDLISRRSGSRKLIQISPGTVPSNSRSPS